MDRQFGGKLADPRRVLTGIRVAVLGDRREALERLVVLLLEILRSGGDELLELGRAHSEELCLVACCQGVVRDLQGLDPEIGVAVEDRLVDATAFLAMPQRFLVATERFEDVGEQAVADELVVGEVVLLGELDRGFECRDGVGSVPGGDADAAPSDLHGHERHRRRARELGGYS